MLASTAAMDPGEPLKAAAPPVPSVSSDERISILLVDDEPKNLKVLETVLEDPGYRLVCASRPSKPCWRWSPRNSRLWCWTSRCPT